MVKTTNQIDIVEVDVDVEWKNGMFGIDFWTPNSWGPSLRASENLGSDRSPWRC